MANYNCEAYLGDAVASVLAQSHANFELIVVDDASTDASASILRELSKGDPRLRVSLSPSNKGPSAARNEALAMARGKWIAVVDSDDIIHPARLDNLLAAAERTGADIVSDDQLVFDNDGLRAPFRLLGWSRERTVELPAYLVSNRLDGTQPCLGMLKPIFRASMLAEFGLRYDETLFNAEDADLVSNMLAQGAQMVVLAEAWYLYRKHERSISRRMTVAKLQAMAEAAGRFRQRYPALSEAATAALDIQCNSFRIALDFVRLVAAAKTRKPAQALAAILSSPYVVIQFGQLLRTHLSMTLSRRRRVRNPAAAGRGGSGLPQSVLGSPSTAELLDLLQPAHGFGGGR